MLEGKVSPKDLVLRFSISQGHSLRAVENVSWTWAELVERLSKSHADKLTLKQFQELPKDRQAKRKNNGYFVGAQFKKSIRDKSMMAERQIITFDIDQGNEKLLAKLRAGTSGLGNIEYVVYSTRTHGNGAIKVRIVIPMAERLPHDHFQALSRILAWQLDFHMVVVDTVSFVPTQIMYWPAHCSDITPVFIHNKGPLLNVERTLDEYSPNEGWRDISILPKSPRETTLRESEGKSADPREKRGIVGAFCRSYDIHEAIETFLSDVYVPSEVGPDGVPTRYSYVPGTTSNGVVVFDDGTKVQSWHGSDPISGMNVNAFDLVRINLYGSLDGAREPSDDPRQERSYKAFERALVEDEVVARELRESHYGMDEADVDDSFDGETIEGEVTSDDEIPDSAFEVKPTSAEVEENWQDRLDTTEKGIIKSNLPNLVLILKNAKPFRGRFGHNEFTHMDCLLRPIRVPSLKIDHRLPDGETETMLEDRHLAAIRQVMEAPRGLKRTGWGLKVTDRDLREAVLLVCRDNSYHPIRDYLSGLEWDGVARLERLWTVTCHTPDTPYYRQTARNILTAAVARVFEPGTKFDFMPVLVGPQGLRKSTLVMVLGSPRWAGETEGHYDDKKKFVEASLGFWFLENGEMTHFRRASDDEAIKAMLSGTVDTVRLSYRRDPVRIPRQFVMIGTTNDPHFLRERHRRIWTIMCGPGQINTEWVTRHRDQLFAEAVASYREMRRATNEPNLPLYLTGEAADEFELRQADHMIPDVNRENAEIVRVWLDTPVPLHQSKSGWDAADIADDDFSDDDRLYLREFTCAKEIFEHALGGNGAHYGQREAQMMAKVMRFLEPEFKSGERATCGKYGRQRAYFRAFKRHV